MGAIEETEVPRLDAGPGRAVRWLTVLGMALAFSMVAMGAAVLLDARRDTWNQTEQAWANLVLTMERDISRNISAYGLSLEGAMDAIRQPGLDQVSPEIRHAAIFDRAASAEYLGSLLVLGPSGDIVADSTALTPHPLNFADRDYFQVHRDRADVGVYVSQPFRSRLRGGDASIAISRRLPAADGQFAGVVVGTLRLAYFQEMFNTLDLGPNGTMALVRPDGHLLVRKPDDPRDFNRDLSAGEAFQHFRHGGTGQFVATSVIDGVSRAFTYRQIGKLPLLLIGSVPLEDLYASWRRKAAGIGSIMALLCGATVALCLLFRREVMRRLVAEGALVDAAAKLSVIASTDGLTGLANRRTFETELSQEWRRAIRSQGPIALLLLDADWFKAYNDQYGHQEGDEALRRVAACIQDNIRRPGDVGARYGGEEFVALLPDTDLAGARNTAERICRAVETMAEPHGGSPLGLLSVSIGLAVARPVQGDRESVLVRRADAALYEAKRTGRARICVAPDAVPDAVPNVVPGE